MPRCSADLPLTWAVSLDSVLAAINERFAGWSRRATRPPPYHYDFSEFDGRDVNPHGEYLHRYFDEYWTDSDQQAFLFRVDRTLAGFALVFTGDPHDIAEFS